jgi:cytoplasmic iron level regulating protein YaaA (DUF328/UPF0246 family)
MLTVLSPAKKLDTSRTTTLPLTEPVFPKEVAELTKIARKLSVGQLRKLMDISEPLAKLNAERFADFDRQATAPAALMFDGDTYTGLDAPSLSEDALRYAQDHLRILSGLYGLLRPLDRARPYRLEMGSRLKSPKGKSLYDFWGRKLARALNEQGAETGAKFLLNCASQEYFGAVDTKALDLTVVTPKFLEDKPAGPKVISFYAKQARGALARYVVENRITDPAGLADFTTGGYAFQPNLSSHAEPVFLRPDQAAKAA